MNVPLGHGQQYGQQCPCTHTKNKAQNRLPSSNPGMIQQKRTLIEKSGPHRRRTWQQERRKLSNPHHTFPEENKKQNPEKASKNSL